MGALLALLSSVSWGTGDFLGGSLSRRVHPLVVMRDAQGLAFFGLIVVALFTGELDATGYLCWGVAGRADRGGVARVLLRRAGRRDDGRGRAGRRDRGRRSRRRSASRRASHRRVLQVVGIVVAVVGVVLASRPGAVAGRGAHGPAGDRCSWPGVAALGFGTALVLVAEGGEHSVVMTITTMRVVNAVVRHARHHRVRPRRRSTRAGSDLPTLVVIGATDAGANGLYALAAQHVARQRDRGVRVALPGGHRAPRLARPPRAPAPHPGGRRGGHPRSASACMAAGELSVELRCRRGSRRTRGRWRRPPR